MFSPGMVLQILKRSLLTPLVTLQLPLPGAGRPLLGRRVSGPQLLLYPRAASPAAWCRTKVEVDGRGLQPQPITQQALLNAACEARREAQPAMHALGNCRFCPPRRQDAHCPILSPTLAAARGRGLSMAAPEPWASVCGGARALGVRCTLRPCSWPRLRRSQPVTPLVSCDS